MSGRPVDAASAEWRARGEAALVPVGAEMWRGRGESWRCGVTNLMAWAPLIIRQALIGIDIASPHRNNRGYQAAIVVAFGSDR